jgi:hypothetical protein
MIFELQDTSTSELKIKSLYTQHQHNYITYGHRTMKSELPVRSAELKHCTGGLVVRWVTTSEYPLLYVFVSVRWP